MNKDELIQAADSFLSNGDFDAALNIYEQLISLFPTEAKFFAYRGFTYFQKKEWRLAIQCFSSAISIKNDVPNTYFLRARAYEELQDLDNALADYDSSLRYEPTLIDAYINKGLIQEYLERYEDAKRTYLTGQGFDNKNDILNNCVQEINKIINKMLE
jgi:tetratricopeptide (TPR) repeat protein